MSKWVKNLTILAATTLLLSGCSLFGGDKDVVEMAKLPEFKATYQPKVAWSRNVGSGVDKYFSQLKPAVDDKAVYVAARDGEVRALSVDKGRQLWSINLGKHESNQLNRSARLSGGIGLSFDTLFIGTENAQVFAIDISNGDIRWVSKVSGEVVASPVYESGKLIVYTTRGELIALDSSNGEQLWNLPNTQPKLTLRGSSTPSIAQGGVIFGRADGYIAGALIDNGQPLWQLPVARPYGATELERLVDVDMQPIIRNGVVYVLAYNGNLLAIDLLKGQQLWSQEFAGYNDITLAGNHIYLTDYRSYVYAVNRSDGKKLWENKQLSYRYVTGPTIANEFLVVGDAEGYLHWIDRASGAFVAQQKLDSDGLYQAPVASATHLYLQTRSGKLIAIEKPIINVQ